MDGRGDVAPISVTLDWNEVSIAARVGVQRMIRALARGRAPAHGGPGNGGDLTGWGVHIEGAAGEMAAAKIMGRYWPGNVEPDYDGDIGPGLHVRSTPRADGSLILHPRDVDGAFMLLTGCIPTFTMVGWIHSSQGKQERFWRDDVRAPAFFIPQSELNPPERGLTDG